MEKSINPSNHILIRSFTTSDLDKVDFAIVELTESINEALSKHLATVQLFASDSSFHNLSHWSSPIGYYCNSLNRLITEEIIPEDNDWTYIQLDPGEENTFATPKNQLEGYQVIITKNGYAYFKAFSKHTNDEYLTESFAINQVLKN